MKFFSVELIRILVMAAILQAIVYFGFNSAYFNYKELDQLPDFYQENIYQYRFLGVLMFQQFYEFFNPILEQLQQQGYLQRSFQTLGSNFYISLCIYNLFFFIATLVSLFCIFQLPEFSALKSNPKTLLLLLISVLMAFSQYVITPYDMSSYFFMAISLYLLLLYLNSGKYAYILLYCLVLAVSTLNRETSALSLSMLFALGLQYNSGKWKNLLKNPWVYLLPVLLYLIIYIGVRYQYQNTQVVQNNYLSQNLLEIKNILGAIFFIISLRWIFEGSSNKKLNLYFVIFTIPYLIIIFIGGILWEIRLFVPVLFPMLVLGFTHLKLKNA